ncbi:MAG: ABC transporter permease [Longimicrobiales bacterium]
MRPDTGPGPSGGRPRTHAPPPPRVAAATLRRALPPEDRAVFPAELDELYRLRLRARGPARARWWYRRQVAELILRRLWTSARRVTTTTMEWTTDMDALRRDLAYAARRLIRSPGFTFVAVLSLALGIGANTAMFSLVNAVLLRELPVDDVDRLVEVYTGEDDGYPYATSSHPDYLDLRAAAVGGEGPLSNVIGSRTVLARLDRDGEPQVVMGELVSWDYFRELGVPMALGRSFTADEDATPGTHPVVVLAHRTWVNDFGGDPDIVGRTVRVSGRPFTVVGVVDEAWNGTLPVVVTQVYAPLMMTNQFMEGGIDQLSRRGSRSMFLKGRLREGATPEQADAWLASFATGLEERYPETNTGHAMAALSSADVALHPLVDGVLAPVAGGLLAVVGLVLLIACANLASFLLARAEDRRTEIAMRLALGAGRGALVRQLLVETTLLALLGGAAGVLLAHWTLGLVMAFQPPIPVPISVDVGLDTTVLVFTGAVSVVAGVLFGLAPALRATNPDVAPTLKLGDAAARRGRRFDLRRTLVAAQISLSFVLLVGAGLFVRSLQKARAIDPGFDTGPAALVWPMSELSGYETARERADLALRIRGALEADPRIEAVAMADRLPLGAAVQTGAYGLPDVPPSERPSGLHDIDNARVAPGYFEAMGVEVVQGRAFTDDDLEGERLAVVSRAFVDRYYPGEDVTGRRVDRGGGESVRIVGVAADTKVRTLGEAPRPFVYELADEATLGSLEFVVRGEGTGDELLARTLEVVDGIDPDLVFLETKTMDEHLALLLFPPRMAAGLLTVFGGLALLLAAVGIWGVVSHAVARRTREVGIRVSLGASAREVVGLLVGSGMRLVGFGVGVGLLLAVAAVVPLSNYLYGIERLDLVTFAGIPAVLGAVALAAAWFPARRAARVDPMRALRSE